MATQQGKPWGEEETDLLADLRPVCDTDEITQIFSKLGYDRNREGISRKGRRLGIKFDHYDDPVGNFTDQQSKVIDEVLSDRPAGVLLKTYGSSKKNSYNSQFVRDVIETDAEEDGYEWEDISYMDDPDIAEDVRELFPDVNWAPTCLPLKEDGLTKFIMLNDVHVPHNIPLDAIFKYISNFEPDYILLVGDIVNNDPFNHWDKKNPGPARKLPLPKKYYNLCNEVFYLPLREAAPDSTIVHWEGNHEYWSRRAIDSMPEGEGYWEVWNNLEEIDMWVPSKGYARLGRLWFTHGDIIKGGKYHANKMLLHFNRNVRYGHYHDSSSASATSPIDVKDRHTAKCCGTLEKHNPKFMENRPHDWQYMITKGYVRPDGTFNDYQINIVNDAFIVDGVEYISKDSKYNDTNETLVREINAPPTLTRRRRATG